MTDTEFTEGQAVVVGLGNHDVPATILWAAGSGQWWVQPEGFDTQLMSADDIHEV